MKKIPLTKGKYAIVDDEDYPYLSRFKWQTEFSDKAEGYYAFTNIPRYHKKSGQVKLPMVNLLIKSEQGLLIYHKNKNTTDNRKENLILLAPSVFQQRGRKFKRPTTSKHKGVCYKHKSKRWEAYITKKPNSYYLGGFKSEKEAAKAYNEKALELYGEYAYQNKL